MSNIMLSASYGTSYAATTTTTINNMMMIIQ